MKNNHRYWKIALMILVVALFLGLVFSPFASSWPDGLEKSAEKLGFGHLMEGKPLFKSPFPDYTIPGLKNEKISTALAGFLGTLVTFAVVFAAVKLFRLRRK